MKPDDIYIYNQPNEDPFNHNEHYYYRIQEIRTNNKNEIWVKYIFCYPIDNNNFKDGIISSTMPQDTFLRLHSPYIEPPTPTVKPSAINQLEIK